MAVATKTLIELEIEKLVEERKKLFLATSESYKRMAKHRDAYTLRIIQSAIDSNIVRIGPLTETIELLTRDFVANWGNHIEAQKRNQEI